MGKSFSNHSLEKVFEQLFIIYFGSNCLVFVKNIKFQIQMVSLNLSTNRLLTFFKYLSDLCHFLNFHFTDETAQRMPLNLQLKLNWTNLNHMKKVFLYFLQKILWLLIQQNPQGLWQHKQIFKIMSYFSYWGNRHWGACRQCMLSHPVPSTTQI